MELVTGLARTPEQRLGRNYGGTMAIYCAQCGKESPEEARFCSACGRPLMPHAAASAQAFSPDRLRTLVRPRTGRKIAGVCQGIANSYSWDPTVVRIIMVVLALLTFPIGFIAYGLVWLIAPEEPLALPSSTSSYANQV